MDKKLDLRIIYSRPCDLPRGFAFGIWHADSFFFDDDVSAPFVSISLSTCHIQIVLEVTEVERQLAKREVRLLWKFNNLDARATP